VSTTFSASVSLSILFREIISSGLKSGPVTTKLEELLDLHPGTTDGQINVAFAETKTGIGAAVTTVYDLIGSLKSTDGTTLNFDEVVLVAVRNKSTTAANYLMVGPDVSSGFGVLAANVGFWADATDRTVVPADGDSWVVMYCKGGVPAAAGTTDELAVITAASTSNNTWDIIVLGRDN
jgi:hypothetical protein